MTLDVSRYRPLGNVNEIQAAETQPQSSPVQSMQQEQSFAEPQSIDMSKYKKIGNANETQKVAQQEEQSIAGKLWQKTGDVLRGPGRWAASMITGEDRAGQAPQILGLAKVATWPADVVKSIAQGLALEGMEDAENASIELGIPFDREKYLKGVEEAIAPILTQDAIEEFIEEKTGIQLQPRTEEQKGSRTAFELLSLAPKKAPPVKAPAQLTELSEIGAKYGMKPVAISEAQSVKGVTPKISSKKIGKIKGQLKQETENLSNAIIKKEIPAAKARDMGLDLEKTTKEYYDVAKERAAQFKDPIDMSVVNRRIDNKISTLKSKAKVPSESTAKEIETLEKIKKNLNEHKFNPSETIDQYRAHNDTVDSLYKKTTMTGLEEAEASAYAVANDALVDAVSAQSGNKVSLPFRTGNSMFKQTQNLKFVEKSLDKAMETEKGLKELLRSSKRGKLEEALGKDAVKKLDEVSTYRYEIGKRLDAYKAEGLDFGKSKFIRRVLEQTQGRYKGRLLASEDLRNSYIQMQKQILRKEFSAAEKTAENIIESMD